MSIFAIAATNITTISLIVITIFILIIIIFECALHVSHLGTPSASITPPRSGTKQLLDYIGEPHPYHLPTTWTISIRKGTPCMKLRFFYTPSPPPKKNKWEVETRQIQIWHRYFSFFLNLFTFRPEKIQWELHMLYRSSPCFCFNVTCLSFSVAPPHTHHTTNLRRPGHSKSRRSCFKFRMRLSCQHLPTTNTGEAGSSGAVR